MNRREFMIRSGLISGGVASGLVPPFGRVEAAETPPAALKLQWTRDEKSRLFTNVQCDGAPLAVDEPGLLDGFCRLVKEASEKPATLGVGSPTAKHGPLQIELRHQLLRSGGGYDAAVPFFREFHVGMATQHGDYTAARQDL